MNPITHPAMSYMPQNIFHNTLHHDGNFTKGTEVELTSFDINAIFGFVVVLVITFAILTYLDRKN